MTTKQDLAIIADSILSIHTQCDEALHAVARINAAQGEAEPVEVTPEPVSNSVTIGGITLSVFSEPVYNLLIVDPRPLLTGMAWQKYDHGNVFLADSTAILRDISTPLWCADSTHHGRYPNAQHFGHWESHVLGFESPEFCVWTGYYVGNTWRWLFQAGLRDENTRISILAPHKNGINEVSRGILQL